jgi:hypothetical protein
MRMETHSMCSYTPGLASSSTDRNLGAAGPILGNFERVFDRLIDILAQNEGVFRQILPETSEHPIEMGRSEQPIEIGQRPSTNSSKSLGGACEPCYTCMYQQ